MKQTADAFEIACRRRRSKPRVCCCTLGKPSKIRACRADAARDPTRTVLCRKSAAAKDVTETLLSLYRGDGNNSVAVTILLNGFLKVS